MPNGLLEPEVKVETEMEIVAMTIREVDSRDRHDNRPIQPRREESWSRSNSRVSTNHDCVRCYRCREYDHFASECPNTPTDEEPDYADADPAFLQMMTQDYFPIDSGDSRVFKLVKGKNGTTPFLPLKRKDRWKSKVHTEQRGHVLD